LINPVCATCIDKSHPFSDGKACDTQRDAGGIFYFCIFTTAFKGLVSFDEAIAVLDRSWKEGNLMARAKYDVPIKCPRWLYDEIREDLANPNKLLGKRD